MSFTVDFDSLMNGYIALMLQCSGVDVELRVPEGCGWLARDVRLCGFFDPGVFDAQITRLESYGSILKAFETLNAISPNTIYAERAFAVRDSNAVLDFVNHFRSRAFRDIYEPGTGLRLASGCRLAGGLSAKRAPAYRFNASRHVISMLRTIAAKGGRVIMGGCRNIPAGSPLLTFRIAGAMSPVPQDTAFLPGGVWLFNRCSDSFLSASDGASAAFSARRAFPGCALDSGNLEKVSELSFDLCNDSPLNAWAKACRFMDMFCKERKISSRFCMDAIKMDGSDFDFKPSAPDVLGYADSWYDTVKRMGIDVNIFRNAVYDYGTHIEGIVNDTFDLFPEFHSGPKAFDAAVKKWQEAEMRQLMG